MLRIGVSLCAILAAASALAAESSIDYSYFDFGFARAGFDATSAGQDFDGDGATMQFSYDLGRGLYLFADYAQLGFLTDGGGAGVNRIDLNRTDFGIGYYLPVANSIDLVGEVSRASTDWELRNDLGGGDQKETGFGVDLGLRGRFGKSFEYRFFAEYDDLKQFANRELGFSLGGTYKPTERLGISTTLGLTDDETKVGIGLRFAFGD